MFSLNFHYSLWLQKLVIVIFLGVMPIFAQEDIMQEQVPSHVVEESLLLENSTTEDGVSSSNQIPKTNTFAALFQAIIALLFVLLLIYITLYVLRKLAGKQSLNSSHIRILETQTIKVGASISIIEVANRFFVVGLGDNVTPITEICDKETIDALKLSHAQKSDATETTRFFTMLKERLTPQKQPQQRTEQPIKDEIIQKNFMKNYTNQLNRQNYSKSEDEK